MTKTTHVWEKYFWTGGGILAIYSLFGPMPLWCVPSLALLYCLLVWFGSSILQRGILLAFLWQWLQVSLKMLWGTVWQIPLEELAIFPDCIGKAYLASVACVFAFAFGIHLITRRAYPAQEPDFQLSAVSGRRVMFLIVLFFLIFLFLNSFLRFIPGALHPLFLSLRFINGALILVATYWAFEKKRFIAPILTIWSIWVILSLSGYFVGFREPVIFMILILSTMFSFRQLHKEKEREDFVVGNPAPAIRHKGKKILLVTGMILCLIAALYGALVWTAVKGPFRAYLNQGSSSQVSLVSREDALRYLFELSGDVQIDNSVRDAFIDRISYIDYLSSVMGYVPSWRPFTYGEETARCINHVFLPRILASQKGTLDDSMDLISYSGVTYKTASEGVAIGMGYASYLYVDWGVTGIVAGAFCLGLFGGLLLSLIRYVISSDLWCWAVNGIAFTVFYKYEISLIKLVAGMVYFCLCLGLCLVILKLLPSRGKPNLHP